MKRIIKIPSSINKGGYFKLDGDEYMLIDYINRTYNWVFHDKDFNQETHFDITIVRDKEFGRLVNLDIMYKPIMKLITRK